MSKTITLIDEGLRRVFRRDGGDIGTANGVEKEMKDHKE